MAKHTWVCSDNPGLGIEAEMPKALKQKARRHASGVGKAPEII